MDSTRYLIVGGGLTADAACKGIRERDPDGHIVVVGDEPHPPYLRPPLSKALWKGDDESTIWRIYRRSSAATADTTESGTSASANSTAR